MRKVLSFLLAVMLVLVLAACGSRFGSSLSTLAELCPDSAILDGYEVSGSSAGGHLDEVAEWL